MDDVLRHVQPRFACPYMVTGVRPTHDLAVDAAFARVVCASFTDGCGVQSKTLSSVELWCRTKGLLPETQAFLATRTVQTFVWATLAAPTWIENDRVMRKNLDFWVAGAFTVESHEAAQLANLMKQIVKALGGGEDRRRATARTLSSVVTAARKADAVAVHEGVVRRMAFPMTVPPALRDRVLLLARLGMLEDLAVRVPHCVVAPWKLPLAMGLSVDALVDMYPTHLPGLAFERSFAAAVFDDAERPSLREALVFCSENWAERWKSRRWSTTRATRERLLRLHESGWGMTKDDAVQLLTTSCHL